MVTFHNYFPFQKKSLHFFRNTEINQQIFGAFIEKIAPNSS